MVKSQTKQPFPVFGRSFLPETLETTQAVTQVIEVGRFMIALWILVILWTLLWKGMALWKAARNNQRAWFVVMLIIHTLGILEILYIILFQKDKNPRLMPYRRP